MDIGAPIRIIEIEPVTLPLPEVLPDPVPDERPAPAEPVPAPAG
jgi:hypothetical protein